MMRIRTFVSLGMIAVALSLSACSSTMAPNTTPLHATLTGANEVPATASTGTGTGRVDAILDQQTHVLTWTVTYAGLTGPVKAGHFHGPAAAGANAPVALGFSGSMESPIKGTATLTDAQAADLLAGKWYVNLHTAANPKGEIRGQVLPAQ